MKPPGHKTVQRLLGNTDVRSVKGVVARPYPAPLRRSTPTVPTGRATDAQIAVAGWYTACRARHALLPHGMYLHEFWVIIGEGTSAWPDWVSARHLYERGFIAETGRDDVSFQSFTTWMHRDFGPIQSKPFRYRKKSPRGQVMWEKSPRRWNMGLLRPVSTRDPLTP